MTMTDNGDPLPGLGHNRPPTPLEALAASLRERHAAAFSRTEELAAAATRVPATFEDEATVKKASAFIAQIKAVTKALEDARKAEKQPYLEAGQTVDATFKTELSVLADLSAAVLKRIDVFLRAKEAEERQRREAEAQAAAAEARRLAEIARKAQEEAAASASLVAGIAAGRRAEEAEQADLQAQAAAAAAEANAADMARTRGDGVTATLATTWGFRDLDATTLDLDALRPYIATAALEQAVRAFIRAGGRKLRGVVIEQQTSARIR